MRLHTLMDRCVVMYLQYGGAISHQPAVLHQHSHAEIHIRGGDTRALVTVTDVGHTSNLRLQKCDVKKESFIFLYNPASFNITDFKTHCHCTCVCLDLQSVYCFADKVHKFA